MSKIPTTVVTGSLGAGKTTLILNLIKQLSPDYKVLWLKNEYGDVNIDSELANSLNIQTTEILNGCICCVLIGKLHNALSEIVKNFEIDRLIIETAGTAYPYPIIHEIDSIKKLELDGLIMLIDALNFKKFGDKTPLARSQEKYIDLIVFNKAELTGEIHLQKVEDEVYDMYPSVPKVISKNGLVSKDILLGLDRARLNIKPQEIHEHSDFDHSMEVVSIEKNIKVNKNKLDNYLKKLNSSDFYRIKGIINTHDGIYLLNYVLGRTTFEKLENYKGKTKLTFIGTGIEHLGKKIIKKIESISS